MKTNFVPLPLPGPQYKFNDPKSEKLRSFFRAMAEQFAAGIKIAKTNGGLEAENAVKRDVDSFISEANNFFPQEFDARAFEIEATGKSMRFF